MPASNHCFLLIDMFALQAFCTQGSGLIRLKSVIHLRHGKNTLYASERKGMTDLGKFRKTVLVCFCKSATDYLNK